jgi:hypothetical protein
MKTPVAAVLFAACWPSASWAGCNVPNCTEAFYTPPSALQVCLYQSAESEAVIRKYEEEVADLERQLAAAKAARPKVVTRIVTAKEKRIPCKKGRTRNASGICGRW